jgi:hypothetical protein
MNISKWWNSLKQLLIRFYQPRRSKNPDLAVDTVHVKLLGLEIQVSRELPKDIPYELTVVIPRVEYRLTEHPPKTPPAWEVLLNSITIAHSPRSESWKPEAGC